LFKDSQSSLDCKPDAAPPPTYQWFKGTGKNRIKIAPGGRYKLFSNGTLTVANVTKNDEGQYSCNATNFLNSAIATASAVVLGKESHS